MLNLLQVAPSDEVCIYISTLSSVTSYIVLWSRYLRTTFMSVQRTVIEHLSALFSVTKATRGYVTTVNRPFISKARDARQIWAACFFYPTKSPKNTKKSSRSSHGRGWNQMVFDIFAWKIDKLTKSCSCSGSGSKVSGSLKSVGFILWETWMYLEDLTAVCLIVNETFHLQVKRLRPLGIMNVCTAASGW